MPPIVLTRELAVCARYAVALAPLECVAMPVTHTGLPRDPEALGRALQHGSLTAVFCASARAAEALIAASRGGAVPRVFAVGPATLRVLAAAHIDAVHLDGVTNAASLAHHVVAALAGLPPTTTTVLVPRAEDGRPEGIAILRAAGLAVLEVIAYRTLPTPGDDPRLVAGRHALATAAVACALFAPSQVIALDALVPLRSLSVPLVAIGETTAAAIREVGARPAAIADSPTPEGVARAVAAVYPAAR